MGGCRPTAPPLNPPLTLIGATSHPCGAINHKKSACEYAKTIPAEVPFRQILPVVSETKLLVKLWFSNIA